MLNIETKTLKLILPYGSIFLIFSGTLKMTIYYGAFNIQINRFLEFSEIVTSFLNDIIFIFTIFFATALFDFLTTTNKDVERSNSFHITYASENSFKKRLKGFGYRYFIVILLNIFFFLVFLLSLFFSKIQYHSFVTFWILINLQTFLSFLLVEYRRKHIEFYKAEFSPSLHNIALYSIIILVLLLNRTYSEIYSVKEDKKNIYTSITTTTGMLLNDSLHYYIGQTKNFIFIYNQEKNITSVYPMSEVKKIDFKRAN